MVGRGDEIRGGIQQSVFKVRVGSRRIRRQFKGLQLELHRIKIIYPALWKRPIMHLNGPSYCRARQQLSGRPGIWSRLKLER